MNVLSVVSPQPNLALLEQLSQEQSIQLQVLVRQFHVTEGIMFDQLIVLVQILVQVKEITGDQFNAFTEQQMGISPTKRRRYMNIHGLLEAHFKTNGRIDPLEMRQFTQRAFSLLGPETDDGIILELRTIAQSGNKVDEKTVRDLLSARDNDHQAQIATLQAEITAAKKDASTDLNRLQLENARLITQDQNTQELVHRLTEQCSTLDSEIDVLRKETTQVQYVDKEVPPAGYVTALDALNDASSKKDELEKSIKILQEKKSDLENQIQFVTAGAEEFLNMKEQVDSLLLKFPVAMIRAVSASDQTIKQHIEMLGASMLQFGHQLQNAVA